MTQVQNHQNGKAKLVEGEKANKVCLIQKSIAKVF